MKYLLYLCVLFYAYGCTGPHESFKAQKYFSIDSLVASQITLLNSNKNALTKTVQIGKSVETQSFSADDNLNSTSYRPKKDALMSIKFLKITKAENQLTTIDGYYLDDDADMIYTSQRNLKMNFNKGLLTSFEIAGTQKVLFTDTTQFIIKGTIN